MTRMLSQVLSTPILPHPNSSNTFLFPPVIAHSGFFELKEDPPSYFGVAVVLQILEGKPAYPGAKKFAITSRKWPESYQVSVQVKAVEILKSKPDNWAQADQLEVYLLTCHK